MIQLKVNGCAICGYDKCMGGLEFHHVNSEDKNAGIGVMMLGLCGYLTEEVVDELNKCILLCANCHAEIEQMEQGY